MSDDTAARLAALEARLDQTDEAIVGIGALIASTLRGESGTALRNMAAEAAQLADRCREAGKPDTARILGAFETSLDKPWSLFDWIDKTFS